MVTYELSNTEVNFLYRKYRKKGLSKEEAFKKIKEIKKALEESTILPQNLELNEKIKK